MRARVEGERVERERLRLGELAAQWLERFGEPIDCEPLRRAASPDVGAGPELAGFARDLYPQLARLLESQAAERRALLDRAASPGALAKAVAEPLRAFEQASNQLLAELARAAAQARQAQSRPRGAAEPDALQLALAARDVAGWVQQRTGGAIPWDWVARCLEWHGHDLSALGADPAEALGRRVALLLDAAVVAEKVL
jgi:hypothetical protein